jgi:two-component system NtrC family sensor kinase
MARRSKSQKTAPKAAGRKAARPKRKVSAKGRRGNRPTVEELEKRLKRRADELIKAREQQAATAEVLQIISSSSGDLKPVFESMLAKAMHLCEAQCGFIYQIEQGAMRAVAEIGVPPAFAEYRRHHLHTGGATTPADVMRATKKPAHVHDARDSDAYRSGNPNAVAGVELGGARTVLYVPMIGDDDIVGVINLFRQEFKPFRDEQIALVEHFASQAVVAIQNARLFNETKEALARQTATSDVLKVIASSPSSLQPVFDAIAERSKALIGAHSTTVIRYIDGMMELASFTTVSPQADVALQAMFPMKPIAGDPQTEQILSGKISEIADAESEILSARMKEMARARGWRSRLLVPLKDETGVIGWISIARREAGPFADKDVELLQTFADQAVIAIQNVELFEEVQARTADLTESLQQQTATADVLGVIASSPTDVMPVLKAIVESACRLCEASDAYVAVKDGSDLVFQTHHGSIPVAWTRRPLNRQWPAGRAVIDGKPVHLHDIMAREGDEFPDGRDIARRDGAHSVLTVPLMREGESVGVIILRRIEIQPFTDKQIALLKTFADQAVIAIGNVRLFDEVQAQTRELTEALTYQTGSANILNVIASSPTDVAPVLKAIVESACELCEAYDAIVVLKDGDDLQFSAHHGPIPMSVPKWPINRKWTGGRAFLDKKAVHVHDLLSEYQEFPEGVELAKAMGHRTVASVPLLREGESIGAIILRRIEVHPFSDKQIALLQTFADQAVIAIGNVRLFDEVQARTRELSQSLDDLRTAQDRLIQTEKLASLGQLTAGIAHEIKNPLNFVNNFSALSTELIDELDQELARASIDDKRRAEIGKLTGMLKSNLEKVVQHGKRADAIVKNMLLHSRAGSGEQRSADVNALVEESLNLAYHGARAEKSGFNITLERDFDPEAGAAEVFPQEITRVLLNLISNGFYAATKRKSENADGSFEPVVSAATRNLGNRIEIRIRDNGTGIPSEVREKIFNPFFTTKPAGEGTGLGLSMSHDIIVKQHGGTIDVDTEPGSFTEFIVTLRRKGAPQTSPGERT